MPLSIRNKCGEISAQHSRKPNYTCADKGLSCIRTNDEHAPRYRPDVREGESAWEKQHGSLRAPTRREKVRAWYKSTWQSLVHCKAFGSQRRSRLSTLSPDTKKQIMS